MHSKCKSINSGVNTFSAPPLDKLAELFLLVNIFKLHPLEILEFPNISTFLDFSGILRSFWRIEQLCRKIEQLCRKIPAEAWHKQMHRKCTVFCLCHGFARILLREPQTTIKQTMNDILDADTTI